MEGAECDDIAAKGPAARNQARDETTDDDTGAVASESCVFKTAATQRGRTGITEVLLRDWKRGAPYQFRTSAQTWNRRTKTASETTTTTCTDSGTRNYYGGKSAFGDRAGTRAFPLRGTAAHDEQQPTEPGAGENEFSPGGHGNETEDDVPTRTLLPLLTNDGRDGAGPDHQQTGQGSRKLSRHNRTDRGTGT